jgi:hypothetical protein
MNSGGRKSGVIRVNHRTSESSREKMSEARGALLAYTERPQSEPQDLLRHHNLAKALKEATDDYMRLVLDLKSK